MKSLQIEQEIGDRHGESSTLHNLATIDLNQGDYQAAKKKFLNALQISKEIGDKWGEASTWYQLGILAAKQERKAEGIRLVSLCYLIDQEIGHGDIEKDIRNLSRMASELGYSQEQLNAMLQEVVESYQRDFGQSLFEAAFKE